MRGVSAEEVDDEENAEHGDRYGDEGGRERHGKIYTTLATCELDC